MPAGLGIFTRTGNRNAAVRYDSPDFGGFKFNVSYAPRDNRNPSDKYTHTKPAKDQYTGGVGFSKNGFAAMRLTATTTARTPTNQAKSKRRKSPKSKLITIKTISLSVAAYNMPKAMR